MPFAATWMGLEIVILSEVSQTEKDKYHMITVTSLFLLVLMITILTGVRCCLIGVLSCISLMISDVEHLLMYLWPFGCLLWENVYLALVPILKIGLFGVFFFLLLSCMSSL